MQLPQAQNGHVFWLNFHGLGQPGRPLPPGEDEYWIEPGFFGEILDSVQGRDDVGITFDDSNESDFTLALPLLKERKMKARFFVVARRIGEKGSLSAEQIRLLCAEGMAVENHGMSHRNWMQLNETELREELVEARELVGQVTGMSVTEAACPFGGYNRRVLRMLREAGYRKVYTSDRGIARAETWIQPRITIRRCDNPAGVKAMCAPTPENRGGLLRDVKLWLKRCR
jgi:peptidoglycan/xylan/chitin deacetylase (PgdA/CDA1 family)